MRYKSPPISFSVAGRTVYVRLLVLSAILPGLGRIADLPAFFAEQASLQKAAESASGSEAAKIRARLVVPGLIQEALEGSGGSSVFEIQSEPDAFAPDLDEARTRIQELEAEVARLRGEATGIAVTPIPSEKPKKKPATREADPDTEPNSPA